MTTSQSLTSDDLLAAELAALRSENAALRAKLAEAAECLRLAHCLMRETGWHLATAADQVTDDGVLETACSDVEARAASLLASMEIKQTGDPF